MEHYIGGQCARPSTTPSWRPPNFSAVPDQAASDSAASVRPRRSSPRCPSGAKQLGCLSPELQATTPRARRERRRSDAYLPPTSVSFKAGARKTRAPRSRGLPEDRHRSERDAIVFVKGDEGYAHRRSRVWRCDAKPIVRSRPLGSVTPSAVARQEGGRLAARREHGLTNVRFRFTRRLLCLSDGDRARLLAPRISVAERPSPRRDYFLWWDYRFLASC